MKYTVELTENGITETLELNGIIYKKEWTRLENGLLQCSQKDFSLKILQICSDHRMHDCK